MTTNFIDYSKIEQISKKDLSYIESYKKLKDFFQYEPKVEYIPAVIEAKRNTVNRSLLVDQLLKDYQATETTQAVISNIEALREDNCYTLCTAHQPSLFTGPLYYIYKIISCINGCRILNETYSEFTFVPVFVIGGEDHDFEEINHFHFYNKRIEWNNDEQGAVGRMSLNGFEELMSDFKEVLGDSENAKSILSIIINSIEKSSSYADFAFELTNALFKDHGLVIVNMDRESYKKEASSIFEEELINAPSQAFILNTQESLSKYDMDPQAYPRSINLFYHSESGRKRIIKENDKYEVLDTVVNFSQTEILEDLKSNPNNFSPNVILRPLYQEKILPNLAYIGGGGEISYWLERKSQFIHFGIPFPMLIRRNSVMWVDNRNVKSLKSLDLSIEDVFQDTDEINRNYLEKVSSEKLDIDKERAIISEELDNIAQKIDSIDKSLGKATKAEVSRIIKSVDQIGGKLIRAEKKRHEIQLNKIQKLKDKLFPGNGLQERHDNFIQYYLQYGDKFISTLESVLDPFNYKFTVIVDDEN